jgi:phage-related protein
MELHVNPAERYYLCSDDEQLTFNDVDAVSRTWQPFPFVIGDKEEDGRGNLSSLTLGVSNTTMEMSRLMQINRGFVGRTVIMALVSKQSGTPKLAYRESFRVNSQSEDENVCTLILGNEDLFRFPFPAGRFFRNRCRWIYKGSLCAYAGTLPLCDKTLRGFNGCESHGLAAGAPPVGSVQHPGRFGGFPGIPRQ